MSGIAEVMHVMGYEVQGSDLGENANAQAVGYGCAGNDRSSRENIAGAGVVTVSLAVTQDNVDAGCARAPHSRGSPRRNAGRTHALETPPDGRGTHGKTTQPRWPPPCLMLRGSIPTVINGGIINAYGTNARLGSGDRCG